MARQVSINIDDQAVKVVYATRMGRKLKVVDTIILPPDKLDDFLKDEKEKDFTVSADFRKAFFDTVYIPPVKKNLWKSLINAELKKRHADGGPYTSVFFRTGQKVFEGHRMDEFFVYYVPSSEVDDLITRFLAHGKRVEAIYPNMMAVLKVLPKKEEPYLCLFESGSTKSFFLMVDGQVLFTRVVQSLGTGLSDYDIQNINMTMNHCRQTLRIEPLHVLYFGDEPAEGTVSAKSSLPMEFFQPPDTLAVDRTAFLNFLIPVCALGPGRADNLFTEDYGKFRLMSNAARYGTAAFLLCSAALGVLLGLNLITRSTLQDELTSLRRSTQDLPEALALYDQRQNDISARQPLVTFINEHHSTASPTEWFMQLSSLDPAVLKISHFTLARHETTALRMEASGKVSPDKLLDSQKELDRTVEWLRKLPQVKDTSSEISLADYRFQFNATIDTKAAP